MSSASVPVSRLHRRAVELLGDRHAEEDFRDEALAVEESPMAGHSRPSAVSGDEVEVVLRERMLISPGLECGERGLCVERRDSSPRACR